MIMCLPIVKKYEDVMDDFTRVVVAHVEKTRYAKIICPCLMCCLHI